jgi:endonuclease G
MKFILSLLVLLVMSTSVTAKTISVHCPQGCPENQQGSTIIHRHIYALSNNPETKFANWVAYEVTPTNYGSTSGRTFRGDPLLDRGDTLEDSDYSGAYASILKSDRGHLAPIGSFAGSHYREELNYMSNVVPQHYKLNRGIWGELEESIRKAAGYDDPLQVITGPLYLHEMSKLPGADEPHVVPSSFFKIVANQDGGVAFIMPQIVRPDSKFCEYRVTFVELQKVTTFKLPAYKESASVAERLCGKP